MTVLEKGNISIHTENIFPIIKKSLYSEHEIFLRELVSNAVDAIEKLKMVAYAGEFDGDTDNPKITIAVDKDAKTLTISDTGIGMTADEVKKYINQVAFSSAEEFVTKYSGGADQPIIGHFGLGFYSSFIVAERVDIDTLSYKAGSEAVHWTCDGSPTFELSGSERTEHGTTITLHLMEGEEEYAEAARIKQLVKNYCDFMPVPIELDGDVLNKQEAIWRKSPRDLTDDDYLEFYRYLYPFQDEPLLWVHLKTDYPFDINGILYFPKLRPDVDVSQGNIKLFCNQVFVSDHCEEIVPKFLLPMRGVIDSPDIPLNVSRSALQVDRKVRKIAEFIAKKVADRLKELYKNDAPTYVKCWKDLGTFVKFGYMNDDKFKSQVEDILIYRTTADLSGKTEDVPAVQVETEDGDAWQDVAAEGDTGFTLDGDSFTTLEEYLDRNKERHENRVFYSTDPTSQATYVDLHKSQGLEVLFMDSFIDTHFISSLERDKSDVKFSRVDSDLDETLLDKEEDTEIVDPTTNQTRSEQVKALFEKALDLPKVTIRTEAIKSDDPAGAPPAMVLLPEEIRRIRDMTAMLQQETAGFPDEHVLVINTAHPTIQNLGDLSKGSIITEDGTSPSQELANMMCRHIYDLALMAQKGFDANSMTSFVSRSSQVLTRLTEMAVKG
ncbi:MAG: molecular chaperone HtpG [Coleofasciculaceae cyanobacterium RL_1_1]|nr:molecular chaperone HtpG [Coleofasciculaceae cyanobacterium RL_1_1]